MNIQIITPAPAGSRAGNNVTASRWARLLTDLGHEVEVTRDLSGAPDLLVALHARRSADFIERFHREWPRRPLLVALTGTDLYHDLPTSHEARQSLDRATRIVVLQPRAVDALDEPHWREKAEVIFQSAVASSSRLPPDPEFFDVCVVGHLREVKDPFRTAAAARLLPPDSRIRVTQIGAALSPEYAQRAEQEERENARYRWLGDLPQDEAQRLLARSRLLVLTSQLEGGANVISEALAIGVPVVSSRISGSVGILGDDYPGYFTTGDTAELARLLRKLETDPGAYRKLEARCEALRPLVDPNRERAAWSTLLQRLTGSDGGRLDSNPQPGRSPAA